MFTNGIKLKIKNKSLAEEAKIIKQEVKKLKGFSKNTENQTYKREFSNAISSLQSHNEYTVKRESRATHLATAFLKGKPYKKVEQKRSPSRENEFQFACRKAIVMAQKYQYGSKSYLEIGFKAQANIKVEFEKWLNA